MRPLLVSLLFLMTLLPAPRSELHGQSDASDGEGGHWETSALLMHQHLRDQRDWRSLTVRAGYASTPRTMLLEFETVEREGVRDWTVGADLYQIVPTGGYVNLRARLAPGAEVLPSLLAVAELFQPLHGGWEGWIGFEHRTYPLETVNSLGFGPGLYVGDWYLRGRPSVSRALEQTTLLNKLLARRFIGDSPADYIELGAGFGREFVEMVPTATGRVEIEAQPTWLLSARAQLFLTSRIGVAAGGVYQSYEGLGPRPSVMLGMLGRW